MADFTKPLHTQSSDEIIELINDKIEALATLSLNDGTWTNVPVGSVAFDSVTNEFKRKTGADTWSTVQLSLGSNSSLTLGSLTIIDALNAPQITSLNSRVADLEASSITFDTGIDGDDFNIEDLQNVNSGTVERKRFNLPDASATARGALTSTAQIIGGTKTFASGTIKIGNSTTQTENWSLESGQALKLISGNTTRAVVDSNGQIGVGTLTPNNALHIKASNTTTGITLEDSVGQTQISSSDRTLTLQAAKIKLSVENSSVITIDNSEKVGIGTETPSEKLDVNGTITTSGSLTLKNKGCSIEATNLAGDTTNSSDLTITAANTTNSILLRAAQTVKIQTSSGGAYQERLTILNNGNIGIGTSTPSANLDVSGSGQFAGALSIKFTSPSISLIDMSNTPVAQSAFLTSTSGNFYLLRGGKGSTTWTPNSTGLWPLQIDLNTNNATFGGSLWLSNSSNTTRLGVGTTAPNEKITVQALAGQGAAITLRGNNNTNASEFYVGQGADNQGYVWQRANSNLLLGTNNLTRLTISNAGDTTIHGTLTSNSDIKSVGNIYINNSAPTIYLQDTDNRTALIHCNSNILYILRGTGNNTSSNLGPPYPVTINLENNDFTVGGSLYASYLRSYGNAAVDSYLYTWRAQISGEGIHYPGAATRFGRSGNLMAMTWSSPYIYGSVDNAVECVLGTVSDYRLKQNFRPINSSLNLISQLTPGTYNPKEFDGSVNLNKECCGLLAHEVQKIIPSIVTGEKDKVDEKGSPMYQSVDYAGLVPYLVVAIKELQAKIKELENKLQATKTA